VNAGDTLLAAPRDTSVDSHLWAIISDPTQSGDVLIVNFTSWRQDKDQACILNVSDHPYISRTTCVNYREAKRVEAAKLDKLLNSGQMQLNMPLGSEVLERIRAAVPDSWISQDNAQFLVDQGLVDF